MAIFADRAHAGRELAAVLAPWRGTEAVVLGIPRGGVVVAAEVARELALPLGVAVVRKLGAPRHEEYAVGAIAEGVRYVDPEALHHSRVTPEQLASVEDAERAELQRRTALFEQTHLDVEGHTAIIVDDGVATGATATAACRAQRARGAAQIVLAVPVAPSSWVPADVDEYVCPHREPDFWAVGQFYDDFTQTRDEEVARLLARDLPDE
ncbi:phosphoribosyltransferase family protein [Microbacterium sp. NPDC019599]|uniref:phosphoribosyltransferase n=1 Tax=Microbacterium sp. NPDC019599 TaxID=3154690 RepID=UPI0033E57CA2